MDNNMNFRVSSVVTDLVTQQNAFKSTTFKNQYIITLIADNIERNSINFTVDTIQEARKYKIGALYSMKLTETV